MFISELQRAQQVYKYSGSIKCPGDADLNKNSFDSRISANGMQQLLFISDHAFVAEFARNFLLAHSHTGPLLSHFISLLVLGHLIELPRLVLGPASIFDWAVARLNIRGHSARHS